MNWFVWRQHRKQFMVFGIILVIFAIFAILTGNHLWNQYQHTLASCKANPLTPSCSDIEDSLPTSYQAVVRVIFAAALTTPLIFGLFVGAPLFSREYEEGTNKLVWTQGVSRKKWLTIKLLWILVFAAVFGLAISLLTTWWARLPNTLDQSRFFSGQFDTQGIVPIAYTIFFTALGFMMSAWFRKTIVALAITLVLFIAFQASFAEWIRPHYMTPVTVTAKMGPDTDDSLIPAGAWAISRNIVDKNGNAIGDVFPSAPLQCQKIIQQTEVGTNNPGIKVKIVPGGADPIDACLNQAGFHQEASFQPSYRYWNFQRIEAGIFLGLTVVTVAGTYWLILKRDA